MTQRTRRALPLAALAVLILLNVALVALLLTRDATPASSWTPPPGSAQAPTEGSAPEADEPPVEPPNDAESPTEDAGAAQSEPLAPATRFLATAADQVGWRATAGSCEQPGVLERTLDRGATWEVVDAPLAQIDRLKALDASRVFLIGGNQVDCAATFVSSETAGETWRQSPELVAGNWRVDPTDRATLETPAGAVNAPCELAGFAGFDDAHGAALCTDRSVLVTTDGGASFQPTGDGLEPSAIGLTLTGYVVAGPAEDCAGLALTPLDVSGDAQPGSACAADVEPGADDVAVAGAGAQLWLWSGEDVQILPAPDAG